MRGRRGDDPDVERAVGAVGVEGEHEGFEGVAVAEAVDGVLGMEGGEGGGVGLGDPAFDRVDHPGQFGETLAFVTLNLSRRRTRVGRPTSAETP